MTAAAVIAAAGRSSRMGAFKPLLPLGDSTIIYQTIHTLRKAGAGPILVVTGCNSAALEDHLSGQGVLLVKNEDFAHTDMLASLKLGLSALPKGWNRVFLGPADSPLAAPETLKRMLAVPARAVCPLCGGQKGRPLLLNREAAAQVLAWEGPGGLRGLLDSGALEETRLETGDPGVLLDADTPQEYQRLLDYAAKKTLRPF